MKLYYTQGACSLVVRMILNELGLHFDEESVDLREKKTAGGENYFEVNPKGAVPALRLDNGQILTEIQAILQYLADTTPGHQLLAPVGDIKRYRTLEWMNFISTELHKSLGMFYNPALTNEMKSNVLMPVVKARFKYINDRLNLGAYLMGDTFTLPDAYLFVMLLWAFYFKIDFSSFNNLARFFELMKTRSAVALSLKEEHIRH